MRKRPRAGPRKKAQKFTGALAQPIRIKFYRATLVGLNADDAAKKTAAGFVTAAKESFLKLDLLFEHFGIARTKDLAADYKSLSLSLAQEFVPGFQLVSADTPARGRPSSKPWQLVSLLVDVETLKRRKQRVHARASDARALADLTSLSQFSRRWGRYRAASLANLLPKARNPEFNPLYRLWQLEGQAGKQARQLLIDIFSTTKNAR